MSRSGAPLLILFDVDGTLLRGAAEAQRDALHATLADRFGVDTTRVTGLQTAGRTDLEIARELLRAEGILDFDAAPLAEAWCAAHEAACAPDLSVTVLPGVVELLDGLAARDDVVLSLLTGNLEPIARRKLAAAGIGHHFAPGQGAFGSDDEDRTKLPAIARERAGARREDAVIVGDTPRDIACARADGLRCIGVATGPFGPEALSAADAVARDAYEVAALLAGDQ